MRTFDRMLDLMWARTSYTRLTAALHEEAGARVTSEPETPGVVDELPVVPETESAGQPTSTAQEWPVSPMGELPSGAGFGTLVHRVLEEVDFAAPDLRAGLVEACTDAGAVRFVGVPADVLADALLPSLQTSLGPLAGGRRLADVTMTDRLDEMDFELPLAGGDTPTGEAAVGQIAGLLRHHLPPEDPLVEYADDLSAPVLASQRLRGFLTGSIDAVLRVPGAGGAARYLVVDYKTNWLGVEGPLTAMQYLPEALARAMRHAHYPLQALLYSVALHRFLRWRQPGYRPDEHLGGVLYLFLRGMCGEQTPVVDGVPCGVLPSRPRRRWSRTSPTFSTEVCGDRVGDCPARDGSSRRAAGTPCKGSARAVQPGGCPGCRRRTCGDAAAAPRWGGRRAGAAGRRTRRACRAPGIGVRRGRRGGRHHRRRRPFRRGGRGAAVA